MAQELYPRSLFNSIVFALQLMFTISKQYSIFHEDVDENDWELQSLYII